VTKNNVLDWLLKTEEATIGYIELKMLAQESERENCTPGKGSAAGQNFLAPRYYGQRTAQCLRLSKMCLSHVCYHSDA